MNGEVCKKSCRRKEQKDLTPPALLEMDGFAVTQDLTAYSKP